MWDPLTWGRWGMFGFNVYLDVFWSGFNVVDAYVPVSFALVHIERL